MINQVIKYRRLSLYLLCLYMWVQKRITAQPRKGTSNDRNELTHSNRYIGDDILNTDTPVTEEDRTYNYDPIGNRITAISNQLTLTYTANELNQYTEQTITNQGTPVNYTYDLDGNMTQTSDPDGIKKYTYNAENRLISIEPESPVENDEKVEFTYDYMGRRVKKAIYAYESGSWQLEKEILFAYDGWNMIKETITDQSTTTKHYIWGLDLSQSSQGAGGIGGLLAVTDGSFTYGYTYDGNGNVAQLIDTSDGSIKAHYEYDPYGNLITSSGDYADQNPYRFSTKYFDDESNLYYYGYRYYSASLGRWINRDPIQENGGINLNAICQNNTISNIDILGKKWWNPFSWFEEDEPEVIITTELDVPCIEEGTRTLGELSAEVTKSMGSNFINASADALALEEFAKLYGLEANCRVVIQNGKKYLIVRPSTLTGSLIKGTKYNILNPKVAKLVGISTAKIHPLTTSIIVLTTLSVNTTEGLLTNETLIDIGVDTAVDLTSNAISLGTGFIITSYLVEAGAVGGTAITPGVGTAIGIVAGITVGVALDVFIAPSVKATIKRQLQGLYAEISYTGGKYMDDRFWMETDEFGVTNFEKLGELIGGY